MHHGTAASDEELPDLLNKYDKFFGGYTLREEAWASPFFNELPQRLFNELSRL